MRGVNGKFSSLAESQKIFTDLWVFLAGPMKSSPVKKLREDRALGPNFQISFSELLN